MISHGGSTSDSAIQRPPWWITLMNGDGLKLSASSAGTRSGPGNHGVMIPAHNARPASRSTSSCGVHTKRLRYRADPSSSIQMPCSIASPSSGNV